MSKRPAVGKSAGVGGMLGHWMNVRHFLPVDSRRPIRAFGEVVKAAVLVLLLLVPSGLRAAPSRFWISTSGLPGATPAIQAPTVSAANGSDLVLYIWAQPETGKVIRNFSLNVITTDLSGVVDFPIGLTSNVVYNGPGHATTTRFERAYDADPDGLTASVGDDGFLGVRALQGFTFNTGGGAYTGIGGASCQGGDQYCAVASNGAPAWLVGAVTTRPLVSSGSASYHLQIGANGINYVGQTTSQTSVVFGSDPINANTTYNAQTEREITKLSDAPDLVLQACSNGSGDYNNNCKVDAADYVSWRNNQINFGGPGGYTTWRSNFGNVSSMGSGGGMAGTLPIPEPTSSFLMTLGFLWAMRRGRPYSKRMRNRSQRGTPL